MATSPCIFPVLSRVKFHKENSSSNCDVSQLIVISIQAALDILCIHWCIIHGSNQNSSLVWSSSRLLFYIVTCRHVLRERKKKINKKVYGLWFNGKSLRAMRVNLIRNACDACVCMVRGEMPNIIDHKQMHCITLSKDISVFAPSLLLANCDRREDESETHRTVIAAIWAYYVRFPFHFSAVRTTGKKLWNNNHW